MKNVSLFANQRFLAVWWIKIWITTVSPRMMNKMVCSGRLLKSELKALLAVINKCIQRKTTNTLWSETCFVWILLGKHWKIKERRLLASHETCLNQQLSWVWNCLIQKEIRLWTWTDLSGRTYPRLFWAGVTNLMTLLTLTLDDCCCFLYFLTFVSYFLGMI